MIRRITPSFLRRGAALAALPIAAACSGDDEAAASTTSGPPPVSVGAENLAVVRMDAIRVGPTLSGSLQPEKQADIRAELPGTVVQTYADIGQRVGAGQPLARIDDRAIRDQATSSRTGVSTASTAYDVARRELERAEALYQAGAIAQRNVELARSQASAAGAQLANARAMQSSAEKTLQSTQVRAPFAGVVATRLASAGDVVNPGAPLFTVVDPGTMRLEASVPANALALVRVGLPVEFTVNGYPDRRFAGRVTRVSPSADPATGQVRIVASIPNPGSTLVGGLFAEGRLASETRTGLVVPQSALDDRGLRPAVIVIKGGVAQRREVVVGLRDAEHETVELRSGVAAGDTVLVGAARGITPGSRVQVSVVRDGQAGG